MLKVLSVQGEEKSFERRRVLLKREITKQVRHMTVDMREKDVPACEERLGRPRRGAARHLQEGDLESDTSACAAPAMFAKVKSSQIAYFITMATQPC